MEDNEVMNKILRELQEKADEAAKYAPMEEMTHVAGVSFVDAVGLSLGAAPKKEATHAGAYRHIANCGDALEALVQQEDERRERESQEQDRQRHGREHEHEAANYHRTSNGVGHQSSSGQPRSSTRLKGEDRHIVIQKKPANEVAVVVLKRRPTEDG